HASEFNENAVSSGIYHTPAMPLDRWIDQIGSQFAQSLERPFLIRADKPAITGHVGGQDSRQPALRVVGRHQPLHPAWIGEAKCKNYHELGENAMTTLLSVRGST